MGVLKRARSDWSIFRSTETSEREQGGSGPSAAAGESPIILLGKLPANRGSLPARRRGVMTPYTQDVIVALSSAAGPGGRAVVRLSGPGALQVVAPFFRPGVPPDPGRRLLAGGLHLPGVASPLPADLYI